MKKTGFTLTYKFGAIIGVSLEPEGTIYELKPNESVEIEISSEAGPAIDIQFQRNSTGVYIALWSDEGSYTVKADNI